MIMNQLSLRWNINQIVRKTQINHWLRQEHCKLYNFIPNMMYSITPEKVLYCNHKWREVHNYFTYLSHTNKYKPYFYNFSDEIYDLGINNQKLSPFLQDLVTTLQNSDENSVQHGYGKYEKIQLSVSTKKRLIKGGEEWLSSFSKSTNQGFLKDLQYVALLWCFAPNYFHSSVIKEVHRELLKRYSSFNTKSCLKAASFLYIFQDNNSVSEFNNMIWYKIVKKLHDKRDYLSEAEIILTLFFSGLTRSVKLTNITKHLTFCFAKTMPYLSTNEVGVIAISNFLTQNTKVTNLNYVLLNYLMVNIDHMSNTCFPSCCKYLKSIKPSLHEYHLEHQYSFLKSFHEVMSFLPVVSVKHGYAFLMTNRIFTVDLLQLLTTTILESDLSSWRTKDLSFYTQIIGRIYPLLPESKEMLSQILNELCKEHHMNTLRWYNYPMTLALDCASRAGYYPTKLIKYMFGKEGVMYFQDHILENYVQHKSIISRLEIDEPELFNKLQPSLPHNTTDRYILPMRKAKSFCDEFINVSTKEFGFKVVEIVNNFSSDSQDLEFRIKDGRLISVDEWQGLDRCIKAVLIYTLNIQYNSVIDDYYNIYYELNGIISSKLRMYEKSGFTIIVAKEERKISELPKYYNKLIRDLKDIADNSENNDVKVHFL